MQHDDVSSIEEMIDTAELLDCLSCKEETLHVQEEVVSVANGVTELVMRCGQCLTCRPWLLVE